MLSTWTIPTDPGFQTRRPRSSQSYYEPNQAESVPQPRVKPEALTNAIKGQGSLGRLFNPLAKPYHIGSRPISAHQPRDYAKENVQRMRQIQKVNREKERESEALARQPMKAVYKPDKFAHVDSKVAQEVKAPPPPPRSNSATFLRAHSRSGPVVRDRPSSVEPVIPREEKLTVPKAAIAKERVSRSRSVNHIAKNVRRAASPAPRRPPSSLQTEELQKKRTKEQTEYQRGVVPQYLKNRQEQWRKEEEIRIANLPDPSIPPGHTLMPRDERLQTLAALEKNHAELLTELNSLPVRVDTLRVKTRKAELEKKLKEIEGALRIFSRPKVFVKIDD